MSKTTTMSRYLNKLLVPSLCVFVVALLTILIIYALLGAPIADDWMYHNYFSSGFGSYLEACMNHTGRLFQWILVYFGYDFFGMNATKIVPAGLLLALVASIFLLFRSTNVFNGGAAKDLLMAGLLSSLIIILQPSFFDTYLWLTSSTVYLASIIFLFININFIYCMLRRDKVHPAFIAMALISMVVGQTFSEPTSAFMIGITGLLMLWSVLVRNSRNIKRLVSPLLALIAGFLVVYLSPGSISRRSGSPELDIKWVFYDSLESYSQLFLNTWPWILGLLILTVSTVLFANSEVLRNKSKPLGALALVVFISTTYPIFSLNNYTQDNVPYRIYTLPVVGVLVSSILLALSLSAHMDAAKRFGQWLGLILLTLIVISAPVFLYNGVRNIEKLSLRNAIVKDRDRSVSQQIEDKGSPIVVMKAPSLFIGNADDFYYGEGRWDSHGLNWIINSFLDYKGLNSRERLDGVVINEPPVFYR